jgi:hypothetical protein
MGVDEDAWRGHVDVMTRHVVHDTFRVPGSTSRWGMSMCFEGASSMEKGAISRLSVEKGGNIKAFARRLYSVEIPSVAGFRSVENERARRAYCS